MKSFLFLALLLGNSFLLKAQNQPSWFPVEESEIKVSGTRQIIPEKYQTFRLQYINLLIQLSAAPLESDTRIQNSNHIIYLPLPTGEMQSFKIVESPIMEAGLAAQFPNIRTYSLMGISDPHAHGKLDWNDFGLHANIRSPKGHFFIDPYTTDTREIYISYYTSDFKKDPSLILPEAGVLTDQSIHHGTELHPSDLYKTSAPPAACAGDRIRTYRLAIACTGEYAQAATGTSTPTPAQILSRVVTTVNRVNSVYESEVSVRLVLIANNALILYADPATDPFTGNNNSGTLLVESQTVIDGTIGASDYDIGHTFSTGGGGLASLGCVCSNVKARGITGSPSPVGDPYDIDYVAHEMGHQFGGNHTFNSNTGSCAGNRNAATSMEPGSGITIMGYAGLCTSNNLGSSSIPYFHAVSYDEIVNFTLLGNGNSCGASSTTGNNVPVVNGPAVYTIPKQTAFRLEGSASDADGDSLTYSWEEFDKGVAAGNWNSGNAPYFRSYAPDTLTYRIFPRLNVILGGSTTGSRGEYYPQSAQTLNFRLAARDGKMGGGGICYAGTAVNVTNDGPFKVTDPNGPGVVWYQDAWPIVTWDVAGTQNAPISCEKVNILISTDGGITFQTLVWETENDGSASVPVPSVSSTTNNCRLKIECAGNIFFDINDRDFTISTLVSMDKDLSSGLAQMEITPNPFSSEFTLHIQQNSYNEENQLTLTDILGKIIYTESFRGKDFSRTIDMHSFPAGMYLIQLETEKSRQVQRILKK